DRPVHRSSDRQADRGRKRISGLARENQTTLRGFGAQEPNHRPPAVRKASAGHVWRLIASGDGQSTNRSNPPTTKPSRNRAQSSGLYHLWTFESERRPFGRDASPPRRST